MPIEEPTPEEEDFAEDVAWDDDRKSGVVASPAPLSERKGPGTYDRSKTAEQRWEEQRRRLVHGAAHVFAREGFAGTSVAAVLEVSGLSRGTFYRHFRDLGDAFHEVRKEAAALLYREVDERIAAAPEGTKLRAGIRAFLELVGEHGDLARTFLREPQARPTGEPSLRRAVLDRFCDRFEAGIDRARERGAVSRTPDRTTLYALLTAVAGVAERYLEDHEEKRAIEAEDALFDLCRRTLS